MRILMKGSIPAAARKPGDQGRLAAADPPFFEKAKQEAAYFGVQGGKRTMVIALDPPSTADADHGPGRPAKGLAALPRAWPPWAEAPRRRAGAGP